MSTESVLAEQLIQMRALLDQFTEQAQQHWRRDEERMRLIDQFINPAMNLQITLELTIAHLKEVRDAMHALKRTIRDEHEATRKAVALHMSDPGRDEPPRERER